MPNSTNDPRFSGNYDSETVRALLHVHVKAEYLIKDECDDIGIWFEAARSTDELMQLFDDTKNTEEKRGK